MPLAISNARLFPTAGAAHASRVLAGGGQQEGGDSIPLTTLTEGLSTHSHFSIFGRSSDFTIFGISQEGEGDSITVLCALVARRDIDRLLIVTG